MINIDMLKDIEAIIFDMDGTLLDSMWVWTAVDDDYLGKYQLSVPDHFHELIEGKSFTETARYFLELFPQLTCSCQEIMDEWTAMALHKYANEVTVKSGALDFLVQMGTAGKKLGIATSCTRELVDEALTSLQLKDYFHSIRTACEVEKGKPAPDVYLQVASDMKVNPENCLVFEDVPMGILAGKNAGMKVCGVDDAFSRPQEARKKELADYYIQTYYDVMNKTYEVLI